MSAIACAVAVSASACGDAPPLYTGNAENMCRNVRFESDDFAVCTAEPDRHRIALILDGTDGTPLRSMHALGTALGSRRSDVAFAFNAGMFDETGRPIGLYVEDGEERHALNRSEGPGNFHLLPNGVFWGDAEGWHVATTAAFAAGDRTDIGFATQSGPMLLIDGVLHPAFAANGGSLYRRNGVCVDSEGAAQFAISESPVSFGRFARLFRDEIGCREALFLDGAVSQLWNPPGSRMDGGAAIGPIVVVSESE